jgi:hypothetical protein
MNQFINHKKLKMKNTLLKLYIVAFYFCSTFVMLAEETLPGNTDGTGNLEDVDPAATPIDDSLWVLVIVGLIYVYLKFRAVPFQTRKDEETQS